VTSTRASSAIAIHPGLVALAAALTPMLLVGAALALIRGADFAQWDNFEVFLPVIQFAHRRLLHGELPLWNAFQNLGEPLHAMGNGGVLYPPYTLCTALVDLARADPRRIMDAIAVLHAGLAGLGLHALARAFGVRPSLALVAAVGGAMSGFGLLVGSVWIHTLPTLACSAWALWGAKAVVDRRPPARGAVALAASLALGFSVGHIQPAIYLWVATAVFALAYAAARRRLLESAPWLAAVAAAAALLAMPSVLPTASLLPDSERTGAAPPAVFGLRGVSPGALLGLLLPVYRGPDGFLDGATVAGTHAGAWLVPALIAALLGRILSRGRGPGAAAPGGADRELAGGLLVTGAVATLFVALSLGDHAPFYRWTIGIPLWSSFRWPFKLYLHALPLLVVAGAIALERVAREPSAGARRGVPWAVAALALLVWIARPGPLTPAAIATGALGLASMAALAAIDRRSGRALLLATALLAAGGMTFLTVRPDRDKTYAREPVGRFGPGSLGISTDYRLLPVSASAPGEEAMMELGLFHSATLAGYYSLTGHRFALTSLRLWRLLPTGPEGLLPRDIVPPLLESGLLRSLNARYVLAARADTPMVALLDGLAGYRRLHETARAIVFANDDALPRVYFASEARPWTTPQDLMAGLVDHQAPSTCAYVEGLAGPAGPRPHGSVARIDWGHERVSAAVEAPRGGFLVVSMGYAPGWHATADGREIPLRLTNGAIVGLDLPPGTRSVELRYRPGWLVTGAGLALLGALLLAGVALGLARRTRGAHGAF
jgi:hypothetical protein